MTQIRPVVLSGGMGSRLWPMSRRQQPKQFQPVNGAGSPSFLQATVQRHRSSAFGPPLVVGAAAQVDLLDRQLRDIGCDARILAEPCARNTGPAVLSAALDLLEEDPDALMMVLPSDHVIDGSLEPAVEEMRRGAEEGWICVLGVTPGYPETGFGYITPGEDIGDCPGLALVSAFVEKPEHDRAVSLIGSGASWASGISLMRADRIVEEFARYHPETLAAVRAAREQGREAAGVLFLDDDAFAAAIDAPTESAIFENSDAMAVAEADICWNDVGAWTAVHEIGEKSGDGNVESGEVLSIGTSNSLIRSEDRLVAVIGMEGVIVVDTPDALLVTNHGSAQKVKQAVARLKEEARDEVETHAPTDRAADETTPEDLGAARRVTLEAGRAAEMSGGGAGTVLTIAAGRARALLPDGVSNVEAGEVHQVRPKEIARFWNPGPETLVILAIAVPAEAEAEAPRPAVNGARGDGAHHTRPGRRPAASASGAPPRHMGAPAEPAPGVQFVAKGGPPRG